MRPLCLAWPDDQQIWRWPRQYLLGDDLLVAPVTDPDVDSWPVYIPGDRWVDPWTGDAYDGPATITLPAPIDRIPVLIRATAAQRLLPCFEDLPPVPPT
jgi:1,3-alpha-isomaltosidase